MILVLFFKEYIYCSDKQNINIKKGLYKSRSA